MRWSRSLECCTVIRGMPLTRNAAGRDLIEREGQVWAGDRHLTTYHFRGVRSPSATARDFTGARIAAHPAERPAGPSPTLWGVFSSALMNPYGRNASGRRYSRMSRR